MKLPTNLRLISTPGLANNPDRLILNLDDLISRTNGQVNRVSEGKLDAVHNAATAAPTTGTFARGDFIRNATPSEAGAAAAKYVVFGWLCVVGGTPGTFVQCRFLTGN